MKLDDPRSAVPPLGWGEPADAIATTERAPRRWRPQATVQLVHFSPMGMDAVLLGAIVLDDGLVTRVKAAWTRIDFVDRWILAFADGGLDLSGSFMVGQPENIPAWVTRPVAWVASRLSLGSEIG